MTARTPAATRSRALRAVTPLVAELFDTRAAKDEAGVVRPLSAHISEHLADALYRTVLARRPHVVVEIGMATGVSSLAILSALRDAASDGAAPGRLISIDPFQRRDWHALGVANVANAGLASAHELIEAPDFLALPELLRTGLRVDFGYVDGWHTFDYALVDFWYLDKMLPAGGVVGFNDCGWRAVHKAIRFVQTHRRYDELDVGLPRRYEARDPIRSIARRVMGLTTNDRYFVKRELWEPDWNFFAPF